MRMIVVFRKTYSVRHIGHLDLMRTMQRALRRSGLPVQYSHGFNPHIQLSFASPLSVGIAGECEIMDVQLQGECSDYTFGAALQKATPKTLPIVGTRMVDDRFPTLMGKVAGSRYRIETDCDPGLLEDAVKKLLEMETYMAIRKTKRGENMCDIIPYIKTLEIKKNAIHFTALNLQSGSLKPSVVMAALFTLANIPPCCYTAIREAILAKDAQGSLIPLEVLADG